MVKQAKESPPKIDFTQIGKSKRLAKLNTDYLDLLSIVAKSRMGFSVQQATLKSRAAKESAKQLLAQLDLIDHMVSLPYATLMSMEGVAFGLKKRLSGIQWSEEEQRKAFEKGSARAMQFFFALDVSGSMSRPWFFAITLYIWTAFECMAGDLWAASLDHATALGQKILSSIPSDDAEKSGLSRRHIDVSLAARYGFDLRHCLGTVLKSKFDFSSVDGIEAAYKQAFGTCGQLEEYHENLTQLAQVRHLIMHRGGVADEKFVKITKLKVRSGTTLSLKLSQVANYMMVVTLGCAALLKVADEWFLTPK